MKYLRVLFLFMFLGGLWCVTADIEAAVLQSKTWTRDEVPLIVKAGDITGLNGETISEYYLWAYHSGSWQQVVFQVDEMAENTGWEGYTPNPFWNYFIWDDIDNGPDPLTGDGLFSSEDEIVMMGVDLGDQVTADEWPAAVPTDNDRIECQFSDVLYPGDLGWVYLFRDNTSPVWTTEDYVDWVDQVDTEKVIDAWGYTMKYAGNAPGNWINSLPIEDLRITPGNGGDDFDLWDTQKYTGEVYNMGIPFCQDMPYIQTYFLDMNSYRPDYVWGIKDGPVRVIRQFRVRGWANDDQWGYHPYYTNKYYRSTTHISERFYINSVSAWNYLEASYDHNEWVCPLTYRDSEGRLGIIDGDNTNDTMGVGTLIPDWVLVTSGHGSYHVVFDIAEIEMTGTRSNVWNDDGIGAVESGDCQPINGRFGDFGYLWTDLSVHQYHYIDWYYSFLPAVTPDSQQTGTDLYDSYLNPVGSPTTASQANIPCLNHGDINLSGSVTAGDAQLAFNIALELITPTFDEACAADCNGSGSVTAGDAQAIFNTALELGTCEDPLPV